MAPRDWYKAYLTYPEAVEIEGLESFEKQTCRNRMLIGDRCADRAQTAMLTEHRPIMLSVPVKKVEHKQLTRDIEISYQSHWQHQHWIALVSTYKHTIMMLLKNFSPTLSPREGEKFAYRCTADWRGEELNRFFGDGKSILDDLFEFGPETTDHLR